MELQTVYRTLLDRAPTIRLEVPLDQLNATSNRLFSTMPELLVSW
jgi:cytochrome P450 monooxygenase